MKKYVMESLRIAWKRTEHVVAPPKFVACIKPDSRFS